MYLHLLSTNIYLYYIIIIKINLLNTYKTKTTYQYNHTIKMMRSFAKTIDFTS